MMSSLNCTMRAVGSILRFFRSDLNLRSASTLTLDVEVLESRYLLSGNIHAFVSGGHLFINGDAQNNSAQISLVNDDIVVQGNDNTRVNGSDGGFVAFAGTNEIRWSLFAFMEGGNDQLVVDGGILISQSAFIYGGPGNDAVGFNSVTIRDDLFLFSSDGNDEIALQGTRINRNAHIFGEGGNDVISAVNAKIANGLFTYGGEGNNTIVLDSTLVGRDAVLVTGSGDDTIAVRDTEVRNGLITMTGSGNDFLSVEPSVVGAHTVADLGGGDDAMVMSGANVFTRNVVLIGGAGSDASQIETANRFDAGRQVLLFERSTVPDALTESRLNDPQSGAFAKADRAQEIFGIPASEELTLTVVTDANPTVDSSDTLLTKRRRFNISGKTLPGAVVEVARDADEVFDDARVVADGRGEYSLNVNLVHDDSNNGANQLQVRATDIGGRQISKIIDVHFAVGTVVRFDSSAGRIDVELLDDEAPLTVANFLNYQTRYENSIVHRSAHNANGTDFVIQGGGFVLAAGDIVPVATDPPVANEAIAKNSNLRGTLALALPGNNINGGTSQWFFNMRNANSSLDGTPFTVFGRVIGSGMKVADAIHGLPDFDLTAETGETALTNVPLADYSEFTVDLTGTVRVFDGLDVVVGNGTFFTKEIPADNKIRIAGQTFRIAQVNSDEELILESNAEQTVTDTTAQVNSPPGVQNYIFFSAINEISGL